MDEKDIAKELGRRFIQRRDAKAVQVADGGYRRLSEPFTLDDLLKHLRGEATYGHYLVDTNNQCRVFAFDIDLAQKGQWREDFDGPWLDCEPRHEWLHSTNGVRDNLSLQLRCLAEGLALRTRRLFDRPVAVAYSGAKGIHVYCWVDPIPASLARECAIQVLNSFECFEPARGANFWKHQDAYRCCEIEVFPKQDEIAEGGYGNLLRLPLGVNRKTGQAGFFLNLNTGHGTPFAADDSATVLAQGSLR